MLRRLTERQLSMLKLGQEDLEQMRVVEWLGSKGYKYTSVPNSTFTKSWKQKARNDLLGLRSGFPDLIVIANGKLCCPEMKKIKGGRATENQLLWIKALTEAGIPAKVCNGADEAIAFIKEVCA